MRITQKTLYDYGELLPEICQASKDENLEFLLLLIAAKTDIEQAYASQCNNYSVLVTCYDEGQPDEYAIVPHDYTLYDIWLWSIVGAIAAAFIGRMLS